MNDQEMELIVRRVLSELGVGAAVATTEDDEIPDIRQVDYRMTYDVAHPANPERFAQVKARTWARLGLGRSGPRYTTSALLRFWADNASAQDAVFTDVDPDLLEQLGLGKRLDHLPAQLSGGEQQRVALARAFNGRPEVLFADEPTGNLDRKTGDKIADLLFSLNREHGTTLILVTHDPQLAARCDRRLRLVNGELQEEA